MDSPGRRLRAGVPRACGDGPRLRTTMSLERMCSPRMRGWTVERHPRAGRQAVFPAHAGMDRKAAASSACRSSVPRACGDGPTLTFRAVSLGTCSPRMRGWTARRRDCCGDCCVFPAHAGMDRCRAHRPSEFRSVPRACGDGPCSTPSYSLPSKCSPRMRGWTGFTRRYRSMVAVFPAHAGMDRRRQPADGRAAGVPRACGDGPAGLGIPGRDMTCSPRMRGWTGSYVARRLPSSVFPAHAGMDRGWARSRTAAGRVPRACGDGPRACRGASSFLTCSPRMRGWTVQGAGGHAAGAVFPAHAGMDRLVRRAQVAFVRVPRACGDGPAIGLAHAAEAKCSPRMRGWTVRGSGMG